jgi:hypothetical protein
MLKHSREADGFTGRPAAVMFSGADAGNGVEGGIKIVMGLFTGARLISEAWF